MSKEELLFRDKIKSLIPNRSFRYNWRPDMLKNEITGNNLEIDVYMVRYNVGFEYQGGVHFKDIKRFKNDSDKSRYHDVKKYELLKKINSMRHSVSLVEIFEQDLKGEFRENIIKRLINTHDYYINCNCYYEAINIIKLMFYLINGFDYNKKNLHKVHRYFIRKIMKLQNKYHHEYINNSESKNSAYFNINYFIDQSKFIVQ